MNLICKLFGHNWKVYHRKKSRTGPELNAFRKCTRCKKKGGAGIPLYRKYIAVDGRVTWDNQNHIDEQKGGDK